MQVIDLTRPLDTSTDVYASEGYSDPPLRCQEWSSIVQQGFRVSKIELGSQTGTHIDAPAHFLEGGAGIEALDPAAMAGPYFLIDLPSRAELSDLRLSEYSDEPILFLRTPRCSQIQISRAALDALISLPVRLWVLGGEIEVQDSAMFEFHRALARAGIFLVENLLESAVPEVPPHGELLALPLRFIGLSGSPCRVIVRG